MKKTQEPVKAGVKIEALVDNIKTRNFRKGAQFEVSQSTADALVKAKKAKIVK